MILIALRVDAQENKKQWERNNINIRIGPEAAFAIGDFNKTHSMGYGGSAFLDLPLLPRFSLIGYIGYLNFFGNEISSSSDQNYKRSSILPLRTGINYKLSDNFYTAAQLGYSSVKYLNDTKGSFSQALGIGYFNGRLDIGARWDHQYVYGGLGTVNFKVAYVISVGLKK